MASNPVAELAVQNAKYIKDCIELHMAEREIEFLKGFEPFTNLECLWLNGNKLTKVDGLDTNIRIKELYVHDNKIETLEGSICNFKFLKVFYVSDNCLHNLDDALRVLGKFQYLESLELFGNPLAEEPNYRLRVIHTIPSLHVLDRHVIGDEEREEANRRLGHTSGSHKDGSSEPKSSGEYRSVVVEGLMREAKQFKKEIEDKEISEKQALFSSLQQHEEKHANDKCPLPKQLDFLSIQQMKSASQLDQWEVIHLENLLKQNCASAESVTTEEVVKAVKGLKEYGRIAAVDMVEWMNRVFSILKDGGKTSVSIKGLVKIMQEGVRSANGEKARPINWDIIDAAEADALAKEYFEECSKLQKKIMMMNDDNPQKKEFETRAYALSQKALRYEKMASQPKKSETKCEKDIKGFDTLTLTSLKLKESEPQESSSDASSPTAADSKHAKASGKRLSIDAKKIEGSRLSREGSTQFEMTREAVPVPGSRQFRKK